MAYVDLNPIRSSMARTPEDSDYTSIQERIKQPENEYLIPLKDQGEDSIPFELKDYLELVDWGGRQVKRNKRGHIPVSAPQILIRLKMDAEPVLKYLTKDDLPVFGALGPVSMLRAFATSVGKKFVKGRAMMISGV